MPEFQHKQIDLSFSVSREEMEAQLLPVRIRDPWWRKALVALGILKPRYRPSSIPDLIYGDQAEPSQAFRGLASCFTGESHE